MTYVSKTSLQSILDTCEEVLTKYGVCNYAEVGRRLGISRQAVHQRLTTAVAQGAISQERADSYRPTSTKLTQRFNTSLSPENDEFIRNLANLLHIQPAYILHAAVNRYRASLLSSNLLEPLDELPHV